MDAYKRMRDQGVQPRAVAGAAEMEARANTKTELKMGKIMPTNVVKDGVGLSEEIFHKDMEL